MNLNMMYHLQSCYGDKCFEVYCSVLLNTKDGHVKFSLKLINNMGFLLDAKIIHTPWLEM